MTTPDDLAAAIEARLRPLANPERAAPMRAYLLGQFDFLGIATPARRAAIKDLVAQPLAGGEAVLAVAERLWRLPERECRYAAIDLLRRQQRQLDPSHLPAIQALLLREPWWETVDGLVALIGAILLAAKDFVRTFVADHAARLSRLTVREACRRLQGSEGREEGVE